MHPPFKWHNSGSSYELEWTDTDLLEKQTAHFKCGEELADVDACVFRAWLDIFQSKSSQQHQLSRAHFTDAVWAVR